MGAASWQHWETGWVVWPLAGERSVLPFIRQLGWLKAREASITLNNSNSLEPAGDMWLPNVCSLSTNVKLEPSKLMKTFDYFLFNVAASVRWNISIQRVHNPRSWYQTHTHADDRGLEHKMFQSLLSEAVNLPDRHLAWRAPAQTPRRPQARTCWKTSTEAQSGFNCFKTPEYRGHWKL